jgi:hypothetical protein
VVAVRSNAVKLSPCQDHLVEYRPAETRRVECEELLVERGITVDHVTIYGRPPCTGRPTGPRL